MAKAPARNTRSQPQPAAEQATTLPDQPPSRAQRQEVPQALDKHGKRDGPITSSPPIRRHYAALARWVDALQAKGRYTFTTAEATAALPSSPVAVSLALHRLVKQRRLAHPRRGIYVVVPPEYRALGAPPPSWYIDDIMRSLGRPYYVGLLSAAALHGAGHQQPQELEVMTDRPLRPVTVGKSRIRWITNRDAAETPTRDVNTPTGTMRISTPEATALDLVRYARRVGGLSHITTVLTELADVIDAEQLVATADAVADIATAQRLGYLLEAAGWRDITGPLATWVTAQQPWTVALDPGTPDRGVPSARPWQVAVNTVLEPDL